ncbi:MAG: stalk domain-containing protein [Syntrophomonadaceae bacterium]
MLSRKKARSTCLIFALLFAVSCFIYPIGYLSASTDATFTITAPAAGDVLAAGTDYTITWTYTGNPGDQVNLTLYKEGKSSYRIASNVPVGSGGSGSYTWKVNSVYVPEGSSYTIRIFTPSTTNRVEAFSPTFSVTHQASGQQSNQNQNPAGSQTTGQSNLAETTIINDSSFVTLKAVPNPGGGSDSLYKLQVQANNSSTPVEVSYLTLSTSSSPDNPSTGIKTSKLTESDNAWSASGQTYSHSEVGGWAMPEYAKNPQSFALPHYRTCVMMLARYEKIYAVFIRENDGQLSYQVFKGGAFNGLNVPGLGQVTRSGDQFQIHSEGGAVEVGIWDKGTYQHDEVTGWARESYQANDKTYPIPKYGMFMLTIARYGKLGLVMGNLNDGHLGTVCFSGSSLLGAESVSGLCEISNAGSTNIKINGTGSDPVEVSQFAFDNTCWQWEVNGWSQEAFKANPQVLSLKHYTPGFITCSRYSKAGVFFYNENDGNLGLLPLNSSTQASAASSAQQNQNSSGQSGATQSDAIKVYYNSKLLSFDQPPVIIGGRTLVPMGTLFNALGASVQWNAAEQMVTSAKGSIVVILIIGEDTARVNGNETALSQPAQIIGGRTMVPLAFVAQALQADVKWDGNTRTININQESSGTSELTFNGKQVVDMFFSSLGSREVDDAMSLMDAELLGDDAATAAWRSLFSSFDTLQVKNITDWNPGEWTLDQQAFKVEFALQLKNGAPETMWMDGLNTRWVFVKSVNGQGKISQLATGP